MNKRFIKFYEVGQNNYYLLPFDDELHIATESFIPLQKRFLWFVKEERLTQGLKLLQVTAPLMSLFNKVVNLEVDLTDEDFPDMTTYKKINNVELRKEIEKTYKDALDTQVEELKENFEKWKDDLILDNKDLSDNELEIVINSNKERLEENIKIIKSGNVINNIDFKWKTGDNTVIKKMLENNMEFLYAQKIGSGYKIYYLYELDVFGTLTIYKVQCVKNIVKSMETFIYNKELLQEMLGCMVNNNL